MPNRLVTNSDANSAILHLATGSSSYHQED
jgi:hypothetical protein